MGPSSNWVTLGVGDGGALGASLLPPHRPKKLVDRGACSPDSEPLVDGARLAADGLRLIPLGTILLVGSSSPFGNTVLNNLQQIQDLRSKERV
jgi:hypothetical protein